MENSKRRPRHRAEESVPARRSSAGAGTRVSAEAGQSSRRRRGAREPPSRSEPGGVAPPITSGDGNSARFRSVPSIRRTSPGSAEYRTGDAEAPGSRHRVRSQEEFMDPNVPTGLPERDGCRKASDPRADDERSPGHDRTRSAGGRAARPTRPGQCSSQRRGQSAAGISMRSLRGARSAGRPGPTSSQKRLFAVSRQSARPCPK